MVANRVCPDVHLTLRFNIQEFAHPFLAVILMKFSVVSLLFFLCVSPQILAQDQLVYPIDVAVGPNEEIYVADLKLPGIWKVVDGRPEIYFQGSKTFRTPLNRVRCIVVDADGTLFAGDSATREVYAFDADKKPVPLTDGGIGIAADLMVDGDDIIVSDLELQRIWKFPKTGGEPTEVAVIAAVRGLAKDRSGNLVAVTTLENPVQRISADGKTETIISGRPFQMSHHCLIVDDTLYVADNYAQTIWKTKLETGATPEPFVQGEPLNRPVGLCRYRDGLLVADPHAQKIFVLDSNGQISVLGENP